MSRKIFLSYTGIIEGFTGLALIFAPSMLSGLLFHSTITEPACILISMIGGAAIFAVSLSCWLSKSTAGANTAMKMILFYNVAVTLILLYGTFGLGIRGIPIWAIIIFHAFQSILGILLSNDR